MQKNKISSCLENLCFVDSTNEAKISRSSQVILFSVIISYYHGTLLTYCHRSFAVSLKTFWIFFSTMIIHYLWRRNFWSKWGSKWTEIEIFRLFRTISKGEWWFLLLLRFLVFWLFWISLVPCRSAGAGTGVPVPGNANTR